MTYSYLRRIFGLPLLLLAPLFLTVTACDSGGNSSNDVDDQPFLDNAFSLTVTDSTGKSKTLDGFGYFATGQDPDSGIEGFVLYFVDEEEFSENDASNGLFGIAVRNAARPGIGQYSASDDDQRFEDGSSFFMVLYENLGTQSGTIYSVTDGNINVTRSESDRVDGDMNLQASAFTFDDGGSELPVTIEGSFRAPGVSSFFGMNFLRP